MTCGEAFLKISASICCYKPSPKYTPPESTNQKLDANEMRLEFVVAFNDSDSTAGWFQFFLGTTLYLSSQGFMDQLLSEFVPDARL